MAKGQSALLRSYRALQKKKSRFCDGKVNKSDVKTAAKRYIDLAVKKGQTKAEATRKANKILNGGCKTPKKRK